jgi:hypothetical protein
MVVTYRVPQDPSRHRVAIWRELRRAGAVPIQQATWALPSHPLTIRAIQRVVVLVERAEGEVLVFDVQPHTEAMASRLEEAFTQAREEEWHEFIRECDKFDEEIAREIRSRKFTSAELDEEEQNLERLHRWHRDLVARDVLGAPSAAEAELRLKSSTEQLEAYAQTVFEEEGGA